MAPLRVSTTKSEWLPDDPTAFVPTRLWKLPFITTWDDSRNQNRPTDSAEEAKLRSLIPGAYCLLAGITLPGKGEPVLGSLLVNEFPLLSTLWEKSPLRSRAVGTVRLLAPLGRNWRWNSWLQKKNSLYRNCGG